ncbi:hypothetical protein J6TS2_30990 [Heyndrickxia sporothermodurans]|nr:hypothetical protein J6TS2_30990 [Heyndrickxia sporothermodurans]
MKYETIKTALLIFLVAISIYLTWTLWTFQVKYNNTFNNKDVLPKTKVEQKELREVIKPYKIILHEKENHFGTTNSSEIEVVLNEISSWKFYDIGDVKEYKKSSVQKLIKGSRKIELNFPDEIPFETYKGIITVNDKKIPMANFDRIIIDLANPSQKVTTVYFVSSKKNEAFSGLVSSSGLQAFVNKINNKIKNKNFYKPYSSYQLSNGKVIFLPTGEPEVTRYSDYWDRNDKEHIDRFKTALFPDQNIVEKSVDGNKMEYNNGTSIMSANMNQGTIYYVNFSESTDVIGHGREIIKHSNDFVNRNGGWMDNFLYFSGNPAKNQTVFRLFKEGLPVFTDDHLAEVLLNWGENQIYEYQRPYMDFETMLSLSPDSSVVKLESANSVLNKLMADPNIDSEKIDNVIIGYQLVYNPKNKILRYEPKWFYQIDGNWKPLTSEEDHRGLE